jgi:CheY-like chemotaxis protein
LGLPSAVFKARALRNRELAAAFHTRTENSLRFEERVAMILIVEDEILIRATLSDYLQDCGLKVLEASNAAEAVEILKAGQTTIDLVFTDVGLPGEMDGLGLAAWIRHNHPDVKVIITSGYAGRIDASSAPGPEDAFLAKPYAFHAVARHLMYLMDSRDRVN